MVQSTHKRVLFWHETEKTPEPGTPVLYFDDGQRYKRVWPAQRAKLVSIGQTEEMDKKASKFLDEIWRPGMPHHVRLCAVCEVEGGSGYEKSYIIPCGSRILESIEAYCIVGDQQQDELQRKLEAAQEEVGGLRKTLKIERRMTDRLLKGLLFGEEGELADVKSAIRLAHALVEDKGLEGAIAFFDDIDRKLDAVIATTPPTPVSPDPEPQLHDYRDRRGEDEAHPNEDVEDSASNASMTNCGGGVSLEVKLDLRRATDAVRDPIMRIEYCATSTTADKLHMIVEHLCVVAAKLDGTLPCSPE
ncbi:MAG: hypothetical protein ABIG71_03200 [Candidatus Uhrbacteria bacterium]